MSYALKELRRRPGRFVAAGVILSLISIVLVLVGGILDGLYQGATGALRAQPADVLTLSDGSGDVLGHSRIEPAIRGQVEATAGVEQVGSIRVVSLPARSDPSAAREVFGVALIAVEHPPFEGAPPTEGGVIADARLADQGLDVGSHVYLGAARHAVRVDGFAPAAGHLGEASLWASPGVFDDIVATVRPDQQVEDGVVQGLLINGSDSPAELASRIDLATGGSTSSLPLADAIEMLPGVTEQREVFNQIIGVTVLVALIVVAMFFALITLERQALYGVLKALGAGSRHIFLGVLVQAVSIATIASLVGVGVGLLLRSVVPEGEFPFALSGGRIAMSVLFLTAAACIGCFTSVRRVLRVDPATAIGSSA